MYNVRLCGLSLLLLLSFFFATGFAEPDVDPLSGQPAGTVAVVLSGKSAERHTPLIVDLTGDGKMEILLADLEGRLYLIDGASYKIVWSKMLAEFIGYPQAHISNGIAGGDLTGDGTYEIVIATGGEVDRSHPGVLFVLRYVGGAARFQMMPGWPFVAGDALGGGGDGGQADGIPDAFQSTPALGDIDGDGDLEIVIGGSDRRLHAFHHNGAVVGGLWPIDTPDGHFRDVTSSPTIVDLDNDGANEIVVGTNNFTFPRPGNPMDSAESPRRYFVYALEGNGTFMPGWPVIVDSNVGSSPAVGDLDGDGYYDIVVGTGNFREGSAIRLGGHQVYAWNRFGQALPGWPQATAGNMEQAPAIGDVTGDGKPEVVIGCSDIQENRNCSMLYAWRANGTSLPNFPINYQQFNLPAFSRWVGPTIADTDGNGVAEILVNANYQMLTLTGNGVVDPSRSRYVPGFYFQGTTTLDQDGDGKLETIAFAKNDALNQRAVLYIWQETGAAGSDLPWPTFRQNMQRTGFLETTFAITGRIAKENGAAAAGVTVKLDSGETTVTDGNGNYRFAKARGGTRTVTPQTPGRTFTPASATFFGPPDHAVNFKLDDYKILGTIRQANGEPLDGVTVQIAPSVASAMEAPFSTDATGRFQFKIANDGTYVLTVDERDLLSIPGAYLITMPPRLAYEFVVIGLPSVGEGLSDELLEVTAYDTQHLPMTVGLLSTSLDSGMPISITVAPTTTANLDGLRFTGHAIELDFAVEGNRLQAAGALDNLYRIEIAYSLADIRLITDEALLELRHFDGANWIPANETCNPAAEAPVVNLSGNVVTAAVCAEGLYALFGPSHWTYLPSIRQ